MYMYIYIFFNFAYATCLTMDMRLGKWNVRSLYIAGSLLTVSRELARYKLDLVGVQVCGT
jgi:hypothetical protein